MISTQEEIAGENGNNLISLDCFAGEVDEMKKLEISLLSPFPDNKMLVNYCFTIWGGSEVDVEVGLWEMKEVLLEIHTALCRRHELEYILALSED